MCQCGFKDIRFNTKEQYLEYMEIQNERNKNGIAGPDKEFMANLEWIRKNRKLYSYSAWTNFNNLRDI